MNLSILKKIIKNEIEDKLDHKNLNLDSSIIKFACFQNPMKFSDQLLITWSRILNTSNKFELFKIVSFVAFETVITLVNVLLRK